jgi:hypothetical protein
LRSRVVPILIAVAVGLMGIAIALPGSVTTAEARGLASAVQESPVGQDIPAIGQDPARADDPEPQLVDMTAAAAIGVSPDVLELALGAVTCAVASGDIPPPPTLTLIDYSRPSTQQRLWVFDLRTREIRFHELVAHGKATGENLAEHFSDDMDSHQSSLGLFVTRDTYVGRNRYSLRLDGLEPGFNSHARERAIVMHGATYVDQGFAAKQGRLGRSWGCPALREAVAREVIDFVRDGGVVFSYYPDQAWLDRSRFLHCGEDPHGTSAINRQSAGASSVTISRN